MKTEKRRIGSTSIENVTLEEFLRLVKAFITNELKTAEPIAKAQTERRLNLIRKYEDTGDELALATYIRGYYVYGLIWGGHTEQQIRKVLPPSVIEFLMNVSEKHGEDAVSRAISKELDDRIQQVEEMMDNDMREVK
jgi:hypothetical protein